MVTNYGNADQFVKVVWTVVLDKDVIKIGVWILKILCWKNRQPQDESLYEDSSLLCTYSLAYNETNNSNIQLLNIVCNICVLYCIIKRKICIICRGCRKILTLICNA